MDRIMSLNQNLEDQSIREWIKTSNSLDRLPKEYGNKGASIAVISSYTTGYLSHFIKVLSYKYKIELQYYESPYGQYINDILDVNSNFYSCHRDIIYLAFRPEDLCSQWSKIPFVNPYPLIEEIENKLETIINTLQQKLNSLIVVFNFANQQYSPYGIHDITQRWGVYETYRRLNDKLTYLSSKHNGVKVLDYNHIYSTVGLQTRNIRLHYLADWEYPDSLYLPLSKVMMSYLIGLKGYTKKCIILDLDNTLWGGIIGEDDIEGIRLGGPFPGNAFVDFQRLLWKFNQCGILLAVSSKNNEEDALEVLQNHPEMILREENFASFKINWDLKDINIRRIAEELNIGLDSIVFIDDNPLETEWVERQLPSVTCIKLPKDPALYSKTLLSIEWLFSSLNVSEEDELRATRYSTERKRKKEQNNYESLEEYLTGLHIRVSFNLLTDETIDRAAQLTQRTNQFNLTTKRYKAADLQRMSKENYLIITVKARDKFGDYGNVGLMIIQTGKRWCIDSFMLSCRALGRGIETTMVNCAIELAKQANIKELVGVYEETSKNLICKSLYDSHGFLFSESHGLIKYCNFQLSKDIKNNVSWINVDSDGVKL